MQHLVDCEAVIRYLSKTPDGANKELNAQYNKQGQRAEGINRRRNLGGERTRGGGQQGHLLYENPLYKLFTAFAHTKFLPHSLPNSFERGCLIKLLILGQSLPKLPTFTVLCFCVYCHLMQEEASLIMVE